MKHLHRSYDQESPTILGARLFPSATTNTFVRSRKRRRQPGPSGRPAEPATVLHDLVRPRAGLRAGLAEPQPRRVLCRRPRPVTHMMPGIWVVLVPVTPFPAAIRSGELRTAKRADLLAGLGECYGAFIICHLRDPSPPLLAVRLTWRAWRRRSGGPGSGMQSQSPAYAPRDALPLLRYGSPCSGGY
jgi:hypothetical protein